jgi:hypothetical protein
MAAVLTGVSRNVLAIGLMIGIAGFLVGRSRFAGFSLRTETNKLDEDI